MSLRDQYRMSLFEWVMFFGILFICGCGIYTIVYPAYLLIQRFK